VLAGLPEPPVKVELCDWDVDHMDLQWNFPPSDGGAPILLYKVRVSLVHGGSMLEVHVVAQCWRCIGSLLKVCWLNAGGACGSSMLEIWWLNVGDVLAHY